VLAPEQEVLVVLVVLVVVAVHNFLHLVRVLLAPAIRLQQAHHKVAMAVLVELVQVVEVAVLVPQEHQDYY
jgi:hypothetical protein